eukprot:TRINITY_DN91213_c0_g1_i1.p1 TRINITY_DN91213_c0_g1~~TRINITY_DN91213_c0_g1_i1.p1  ORF type:complete len:518 (+),score=106.47 TRINITY_DN91213_c0_g1_i1:63-1556(+)
MAFRQRRPWLLLVALQIAALVLVCSYTVEAPTFIHRVRCPPSGVERSARPQGFGASAEVHGIQDPEENASVWDDTSTSLAQQASCLLSSLLASALVLLTLIGRPSLSVAADSKSLSAVAPCLLSKCQVPLAKCILNPNCAADLACILSCTGRPDESSCQIKCGDNFENDVVTEFNACALSAKKCVPQRPDVGPLPGDPAWDPVKGRYPVPPQESIAKDFDVSKFKGRWYITAGLNPLFDIFDCQVHFFDPTPKGTSPAKLVGKINWRISEIDGEYLSKSTVQSFVETSPGVLENHGNEYLHYQDDWYVLDHGDEDDPEKGWALIYYRGQNDAWAGYGGGTLYTRASSVPDSILERVRAAAARANVPYDKFWKTTDNSCNIVSDPVKLRLQYAERLLEQSELSAEAQLTLLARSSLSAADAEEKMIVNSAMRLEGQLADFIATEVREIGDELKKDEAFLENELKKDEALLEQELEKDEKWLEAPFKRLLELFTPPARR